MDRNINFTLAGKDNVSAIFQGAGRSLESLSQATATAAAGTEVFGDTLLQLGDYVEWIPEFGDKAALAMTLFGYQAKVAGTQMEQFEVLSRKSSSALESLSQETELTAQSAGRAATAFGEWSEIYEPITRRLGEFGGRLRDLFRGIGIPEALEDTGRALRTLGPLAEAGTKYFTALADAQRDATAGTEGFFRAADYLPEFFEDFQVELGTSLVGLSEWVEKITKGTLSAEKLLPIVGGLRSAIESLGQSSAESAESFVKFFKVLAIAPKALVAMGKALILLRTEAKTTREKIAILKDTFVDFKKSMNPKIKDSLNHITEALKKLADEIKARTAKAVDSLKEKFEEFKDKVEDAAEKIKEKLEPVIEVLKAVGVTLLALIGRAMLFRSFANIIANALSKVKQSFEISLIQPVERAKRITLQAISDILSRLDEFVEMAGPIEGIGKAFLILADRAGVGGDAMIKMLKSASYYMADSTSLMKQFNIAAQSVSSDFATTLPEVIGYLGKLALATGEDLNYMLASYVKGVSKMSPMILDNLHIQVSQNEATKEAVELYGLAEEQLSKTQLQMGMAAVVARKLAQNTTALIEPTGTLSQKWAALKASLKDARDVLIRTFTPAAKAVIDLIRTLVGDTHTYSETLMELSAAITVIVEGLTTLLSRIKGLDLEGTFINKLKTVAWKALEWGANIATNLAAGLVKGASTALISAMNFIGNILAHWLAPGSAPLIAPLLGKWGAGAFTEWLKGFSTGDFDVLTAVQAPLKSALDVLVGLGEIEKEELAGIYTELTTAMTEALAGGDVPTDLFEKMKRIGGEYGNELESLFHKQIALADATKAVEVAETKLKEARDAHEDAKDKVSDLAREYNKLARAGADKSVLAAKMAELKASYATQKAKESEIEEAEDAIEVAKKEQKEKERIARLQEGLLRQLIDIGQMQVQIAEDAGDIEIDIEFPEFSPLIDSIDDAFEAIKARVKAKLQEIWASMVQTWEESGAGQLFARLKDAWSTFYETKLKPWWDTVFLPWLRRSIERIKEVGLIQWLSEEIPKGLETLGKIWAIAWPKIRDKFVTIWNKSIKPAFIAIGKWVYSLLPRKLQKFILYWYTVWTKAREFFMGFWDGIRPHLDNIKTRFEYFTGTTLPRLSEAWDNLKVSWNDFLDAVGNLIPPLADLADKLQFGPHSVGRAVGGLAGTLLEVGLTAALLVLTGIANGLAFAFNLAAGALDYFKRVMGDLETVLWKVQNALKWVRDWIDAVKTSFDNLDIPDWLTPGSPTPLELGLRGISKAMKDLPDLQPQIAFATAPTGGGGGVYEINMYFGTDSVRSDDDITRIADEIQKRLELQGIRSRIA